MGFSVHQNVQLKFYNLPCEKFYEEENGKSPEYFDELYKQFGVSEDMMEYL